MGHIAFIDIETTGLDHGRHEIIDVGVVIVESRHLDSPLLEISHKIRPQHIETAEPKALEVNGYNEKDWWDALNPKSALRDLADYLQNKMLAGHNVQGFDIPFLQAAYRQLGLQWPDVSYRVLDTMSLGMPLWFNGEAKSCSLDSYCEALGIKRPEPHRALDDAKASLAVVREMLNRYGCTFGEENT